MISQQMFMWAVVIYIGLAGTTNVLMALAQCEKKVRPKYGAVEGVAGLCCIGLAIAMVMLS
jgi:hypothetical protein